MSWINKIISKKSAEQTTASSKINKESVQSNSIATEKMPTPRKIKHPGYEHSYSKENGYVSRHGAVDAVDKQKIIPYIPPKGSTQDEIIQYLKSNPAQITFIHGKAGCGKTYLLQKVERGIYGCQILAPTNLACKLYKNAKTLHSFFYGAFDDLEEGYQDPSHLIPFVVKTSRAAFNIESVKILIIDEISMVRSDTFEMMNRIFQIIHDNSEPFGGVPVVVVGDLFQLPPIVSDDAVGQYLEKEYKGSYFFHSHVIQKNIKSIKLFELTKSFRQQNDQEYVKILDAFRTPMDASKKVEILEKLNTRVVPDVPKDVIRIASSNEEVRKVNSEQLANLGGIVQRSVAKLTVKNLKQK